MDDTTKSYLVRGAGVVALVLGLAVALPVIYLAFLASWGLLGIAAAGIMGVIGIKGFPLLMQKAENRILKLEIAEAEANPIEEFMRGIELNQTDLNVELQSLAEMSADLKGLESTVKDQKRKDPGYDYSTEEGEIEDAKQAYVERETDYQEAVVALEEKKQQGERMKFKFKFGTQLGKTLDARNNAKSVKKAMLDDVALQAANRKWDESLAKMRVNAVRSRSERSAKKAPLVLEAQFVQQIPKLELKQKVTA